MVVNYYIDNSYFENTYINKTFFFDLKKEIRKWYHWMILKIL
nr:MAG TPA: hypothetical protein [Caudoviricetes sp.]